MIAVGGGLMAILGFLGMWIVFAKDIWTPDANMQSILNGVYDKLQTVQKGG